MALTPFATALKPAGVRADSTTDTYDLPTRGCDGVIVAIDVTAIGNGKSYATSATITLPLTITAGVNDQFEYNEVEYLIPAAVYTDLPTLATAVTASTRDEDFGASPVFSTLVLVTADPNGLGLRFTSVPTGVNTLAFGTGLEHDGLASLGLTDGWTIAQTEPAGADGTFSMTPTLLGVLPISGKTYTLLVGAAITTVSTVILQVQPAMVAVANLVANAQLPATLRVSITHTTNNSVTSSVEAVLAP